VTVELHGFGWRHAGRRAWAVRGVDLRIERGERVLLLGPSGAGKSTLLAALAGLLADDSGEQEGTVTIDGVPARAARSQVGIVFQDPQTQLVMSRSGDDVAFGLENRGVPTAQIWSTVDETLERVGFAYPKQRSTSALSGGEQQRLALAGAIVLRPSLLLLDEPTANLDPEGAYLVRAAVSRVIAGRQTTLVLVEHRVSEALPLVDRVVVLDPAGGLLADGPPDVVFADHGAALAAAGTWVPDQAVLPRRSGSAAGEVLLRTEGVGFRHAGADRPALAPATVDIQAGQTLAVLGPNGSGKTTLALLLGGLLAPTYGKVVAEPVLAATAGPEPHRWRAPTLARRIGSVFQDPSHQFLRNRVRDELLLGAADRSIVDELLQRLRLDHLALANPYTLSGGEQRRLSVATALASAPRVLVLDEPTFGQDRRTWTEMVDLLAKLRDDGCGVVTVTHDPDFVGALADRTVQLDRPL
jgi:energy-coupling factor transporter ATP-binding protein EcfA2